jgi:hypothetical protein
LKPPILARARHIEALTVRLGLLGKTHLDVCTLDNYEG